MSIFTMPSLGADMEEGKLVEWLVQPGNKVKKGDIVAVVETQKGAIKIEIFEAGEINALLAEPGQTLPVGAPLARLGAAEEGEVSAPVAATKPAREVRKAAAPQVPVPAPEAKPVVAALPGGALLASPAARTRAAELGIALEVVGGSGPGGAILLSDVERHAPATPRPAADPVVEGRQKGKPGLDKAEMRRAIAAAMSRAKREIPHYYLMHEIDLQSAQDRLTALNADRTPDQGLLMGAFLIHATVKALAKVPELNGRFEDEPYVPSAPVHCGMAVAMRGAGLIAPAILEAQDMDPYAIMAAMRDLVARTRTGRLRNSEITQGTITISSLGENGVDALIGAIYPPQVALVGFGAPRLKPLVRDGNVQPRLSVTATLAANHRISDGRPGGPVPSRNRPNLAGVRNAMTPAALRAAFLEDLTAVVPDLDAETIGDNDHMQDDLGLDSMDFLNLVSALHKRFGLPIPEADYPRLATMALALAYLDQALAG